MKKENIGSSFDDFLEEQGIKEEVEAMAAEKIEAVHKESNMEELNKVNRIKRIADLDAGEVIVEVNEQELDAFEENLETWKSRYCRISEEAMKLKDGINSVIEWCTSKKQLYLSLSDKAENDDEEIEFSIKADLCVLMLAKLEKIKE